MEAPVKRTIQFSFLFLTCTALGWGQAQATTGVIQGTIADPTGAAVPDTRVEAKNLATNFTRSQDSDASGRFALLQMPPGRYTVTASKPGFATIVRENLELTVGQALSLTISMRISSVSEEITITAEPVDVTRVESSTTLNELTVSSTPVLGRKFEDLLTLTPGVSVVQGPDGDEINFAGQRGIFNNVSFDGGDYNNGFVGEQLGGQRAAIDIPPDAVRESPVVAAGATAEVGRTAALINGSADCQRLALINFIKATRNQDEGLPIKHQINNDAFLEKVDWDLTPSNKLAISYNFDYSKNTNQTFDVATYGNSANGIEGPSKINNFNVNLFSSLSSNRLNEAHFSYTRELRPRNATPSNVPADTAMGFATTFRFGNPFFLNPTIDELLWRTDLRDNFSIIHGNHTMKLGGEWLHTLNDQVFRGFFEGRYIFDSVSGFLRYASPAAAGGFGPTVAECFNNTTGAFTGWITQGAPFNQTCAAGSSIFGPANSGLGGPLLLYLQNGIPTGIAGVPPPGKSTIKNEDLSLFAQDSWSLRSNFTLNYGLRWEAQIFPKPIVPPAQTAYGALLSNPRFPSDGTLHSPKKEFQPRVGFAWDVSKNGKSVLRASYGIFYGRQNMLTQVGSITDNGVQQFGIFCNSSFAFTCFGAATRPPTWPGIQTVPPSGGIPSGASVRVFDKNYANPRIYTLNAQFEQEIVSDLSLYFDFTHSKGVHLTRFLNYNRTGPLMPATPLFPTLGDVFVTSAVGKSLYNGFTVGMRKRMSRRYQFEWNYVLSKDQDDDSNERDPFTDRSLTFLNLSLDYSVSDRDIWHKFNFYSFVQMGWGLEGNFRVQARSAQPISGARTPASPASNTLRKDNAYFSF